RPVSTRLADVGEHLVFPLGLVDRQLRRAFYPADVLHHPPALVQQGHPPPVEVVDQHPILFQPAPRLIPGHACAPNPRLSSRVNDSSSCSSDGFPLFRSISRTNALPT